MDQAQANRERREAEKQARIQERRELNERARERMEAERELARQRQIGIGWLAFKAGFFGALGVAVASPVIAILVAIFWAFVFGAISGM